jgi:hypothetical protein
MMRAGSDLWSLLHRPLNFYSGKKQALTGADAVLLVQIVLVTLVNELRESQFT